jgi:hypothetical protein
MNGKASRNIDCPLFPEEPDVWESLDSQTQQEVESLIARLLVIHVNCPSLQTDKPDNTKENQL